MLFQRAVRTIKVVPRTVYVTDQTVPEAVLISDRDDPISESYAFYITVIKCIAMHK